MRYKILLVTLFIALCACQRQPTKVIGVVPKGASHIFWQTVHAGAVKAAQESNYRVEWNAPTLEIDASRQIAIVESMINRRVSGIALAPVDRKALVAVVERAADAGIPVAIFDSAIDTSKIISYVATDNTEAGRMAARRLSATINGKGEVGVVGFMAGSASTIERETGFEEEIRKNPAIRFVGVQFGLADRAKSMAVTENMLTAHTELNGLFADNESSSDGAVQALRGRNARQVKLVAFDSSVQLERDLREGWIDALVVQNPFKMGYESTRAITQKLAGTQPVARIDSGATVVTRENLDQASIQQLLHPDIAEFLK